MQGFVQVVDEWNDVFDVMQAKSAAAKHVAVAAAKPALEAQDVGRALGRFGVARVDCFRDEGFPWVQVFFEQDHAVHDLTLVRDVGQAICAASGGREVVFNALRSRSILYLIDQELRRGEESNEARLPARSYGTPIADLPLPRARGAKPR